MSDLVTILAMGALLGAALILGIVMISLRQRDRLRRGEGRAEDDNAWSEGR